MKNKIIYIGAVVISILCLVLRWPKLQKEHEINKLKLEKEKIVAELSWLNSELQDLKDKWEMYCGENSILQASWDIIRNDIAWLESIVYDIDMKLIDLLGINIKENNTEILLSNWDLLWHKYIVIHHTATRKDALAEDIESSWQRKYGRPAAHFIIPVDWNTKYVYDLDKNAGSTMNNGINNYAIQIELVGNFNEHKPSLSQYKALQEMIISLEETYWELEIIPHRDASPSACPWKYIDMEFVKSLREKSLSWYIEFNLSRYYSPAPNQSKYFSSIPWYFSQEYLDNFKRYEQWYEMDVCMNCWCQLEPIEDKKLYDCTVPADWKKLKQEEAMKVVACPQEYPLWTRFYIEWLWEVVCRDRGWAIKDNRIDVWMWYWMDAINNWEKVIPWEQIWFIIK
jgi:hypothetical protein